jgi:hypothetical protein
VELGEHQCYARISSGGKRLPTFSVSLDPPLPSDSEFGAELALASAQRYGREVALVEGDRQSAIARVLQARTRHLPQILATPNQRSQHRPRKKKRESQEVTANA